MDKMATRVAAGAAGASREALLSAVLDVVEKANALRANEGVGQLLGNELLVTLAKPLGLPIEFGPYGALVDRMEV